MIKRELKINFKSFIIWLLILICIFSITFMVYPSIMSSEKAEMLQEMLETFPKEMVKAFNMDISNISTAYGWFTSEGIIFILLITGIYSALTGGTILLKEENDKTIEYLNSLPISRTKIILNKIVVSLIYMVLLISILTIFNYIGLSGTKSFKLNQFLLLSISPLLSSLTIFSICLFISTILKRNKKMVGIGLSLVFISYFFKTISELDEKTKYLRFFSTFTLADTREIILKSAINPICIIISIFIIIVFIIFSIVKYNRKELI